MDTEKCKKNQRLLQKTIWELKKIVKFADAEKECVNIHPQKP